MNDIVTERTDGILRIEFNRPGKKNAMTGTMYTDFAAILDRASEDDEVCVVLWHSAGDAFCAGNDMEDFLKGASGAEDSPQSRLMDAFVRFEKPIVVAVQGAAVGGGTTMLTHCDLVYAGESARFQLPFVNLALVPEFGSSYSLPARIGYLRAAELYLLAEPFGAARAAELGLVTRVVPDEHLFAAAMETARKLAAKPSGALRACRRLLRQGFTDEVNAAINRENREFGERLHSMEAKEAISAFLERRPPNFRAAAMRAAAEQPLEHTP